MEWADELAARVAGPQVINDSKTPSGTVHVGSLRGPVILDVITRALRAAGHPTTLLYGVDDLDAMDAQALLTPDAVERYMGVPLAHIPDQVGDGHASYARHHAQTFIDLFADLGIHPDRYYWMSDIYPTGAMDPYIRLALDRAAVVRELYRRVSKVHHPDSWHPVLVICERCGKVGTTIVTSWDGERVFYECRPDLVAWARGCGMSGWVAPFGGRAKLPWNLEWAAQWSLFGVTIEPNGKDLATAGGSRDRSEAIAREVFEREPPINVPYEFLNIGGRKMSTSKGRGAAAHRIVDVLPSDQLRFLMIRHRPNQAIDFDPVGTDAIPRVFDEFDAFARATAGSDAGIDLPPGFAATFGHALTDPSRDLAAEAAAFRIPFRRAATFVEGGARVEPHARAAAEKGSPLVVRESELLEERLAAARRWLEEYAPERDRFSIADALPEAAAALDSEQRVFLGALAAGPAEAEGTGDAPRTGSASAVGPGGAARSAPITGDLPTTGDAWQAAIFATAGGLGLSAARAFAAIYLAFLGRSSGPRAGWLLASLDPAFVSRRLREAAAGGATMAPAGGGA